MQNLWSEYVQSSEELFLSRQLRFRRDNGDLWLDAMKLSVGMNVLEVGAGSGPFCLRIKELMPSVTVTGLDRDEGHLDYAKAKASENNLDCNFVLGDALELPFKDNTFDAVTSHTVIEHIETTKFLSEQMRVLKSGGVCSVLSVRTGLSAYPESWANTDDNEEDALNKKAWANADGFNKEHGIAAYPLKEQEIPKAFEAAGFADVAVNFIHSVWYCPDSSDVDKETAIKQIEMNRIFSHHSVKKALAITPEGLTGTEREQLTKLIDRRFDKRIQDYLAGVKHWDMAVSSVMAVTGFKHNN